MKASLVWLSGYAMCGAAKLWWVDHDPWALFVALASIACLWLARTAQAIEAGTDETRNAAQPEGRERGPKGAPQ